MEKLQKALSKARAKREGTAPPPDRADRPAARRARATGSAAAALSEAWAAIPALTPDPAHLRRHRIVAWDAGAEATPFDILRTKVLVQMRKNGWRRLAVTSPTPGCGKTTTICNLAAGLTRQGDLGALAIDMDLRRPNMATLLGHRPEHDVTEMLAGTVPFAEQAVRLRDNVAVSMARRAARDPAKVMLSQETRDTLDAVEDVYRPDLMIFDLPPLLISDDARAFLSNVDCVLMVARAEHTTAAQIDDCEREIADQSNVLGVVLNQCRYADEAGGGYAYRDY